MNFFSQPQQNNLNILEEKIKCLSLKYKQQINEIQIFKEFISNQDDEFAIWKNAESQVKSVCGADIQNGELTFQCFTCAPDPYHMFCNKCFNPDQHINHKCIIKRNIGGACDCGDEQTIIPSGFCCKHQGISKFDYNQELSKISDALKSKIQNFIKALSTVYLQLMRKISIDHDMFNVNILRFYHLSEMWLIIPFKEVIDSEYNIEEYYRIFQQALYLNQILFKMCYWLTESRLCFIILLSKIFQQQLTPQSSQSIFEDLLEVQVLIESQGPQPALKIESLLFRFYADYQFKQFIQACYIRKYKSMWLQKKLKVTKHDKSINDYLHQLQYILNFQIVRSQYQDLVKVAQQIKTYIKDYKSSTEIVIGLYVCEIHEQHTQYVAEQLQDLFLNHKDISCVYDQIRALQDIVYSHTPIETSSSLQYSIIFNLRYEYTFFYRIGFKQLKQALGDYQEQFFNGEITRDIIQNFKYQNFTITAYINCFNQIKTQHLQLSDDNLTIWQQDIQDAGYFLIGQGYATQVVQIGVQKLFDSQFSTPYFKENMIKLLLIQCYSILKKKSKTLSIDMQLQQSYKTYIENKKLTQVEIFDRLSKIYLQLIKSLTVIERIFTYFLSQLYCLKKFSSGKDFESYILDLLQEDKKELKIIFYEVLSKCLQVYTSIQFCQNEILEQIYLGQRDSKEIVMLESYDSTFLKFYLFLFENEGFRDLVQIIKNRKIPIASASNKLLCCLILRMLSSDLDLYNVCCSSSKNLHKDLQLSLAKAIQNFYNLSTYLPYTDIEILLKRMGIQTCSYLPDHVLQICEVDQAVKQLKLKSEYRVIYDPAIFNISTTINSQIVEKLIEQNKFENMKYLGNGILWDIELFSQSNFRTILYQLLKEYCKKEYIQNNIDFLNIEGFDLIQAYQLLYIQIVAANYFRKQELITDSRFILVQLEQILKKTQRKDDIQRIQVLIQEIHKIITVDQKLIQKQQNDNKKNLQNKKNQFKDKYNKMQKSEFIQNMLVNNNIKENNGENDDKVCSSCKLPLSLQNSVAMMLLIKKPQTSNFSIFSKENLDRFKNKQFNIIDIGIADCKHYFHYTCLIERFEADQQYRYQNTPDWVKIGCPVCKMPCTITLPIQRQLTSQDVETFNSDLQLFVSKNTVESLFEDSISALLTLTQTYYNMFIDLLLSLFQNPSEFIRDQKNFVFYQLLQILSLTNLETVKDKIKEKFQFQTENNFILQILSLIQKYIVLDKNLERLKLKVIDYCIQCNIDNEIKKQLALSLNLQDEIQQQIQDCSNKLLLHQDISDQLAIINQKQLIEELKCILGLTFKEFYCKYFTKKCYACGFYNKDQRDGGFQMCLFCSKTFCIYSCEQQVQIGNLNQHANNEHNGISFYVDLRIGYVTLLCSPISIQQYKCLYYDQLGQKIDIENQNSDWNTFYLDIQKVKEISQIILNNSYQTIIRNLEVRQDQLDMEGRL
ncbi:unnamed protein product [Paramecium sonneborni]|uniref:RING-type E3 ubiquitin transferase n=1 Tax=Paramecium sonneborni TaxID=65129 RepID=A0A8S1P4W1_9CILI|nr:unnamed protein product [Paramecium sonneborni]